MHLNHNDTGWLAQALGGVGSLLAGLTAVVAEAPWVIAVLCATIAAVVPPVLTHLLAVRRDGYRSRALKAEEDRGRLLGHLGKHAPALAEREARICARPMPPTSRGA